MLVDMKQKPSKAPSQLSNDNDYPYGLSISLDEASLKKLGLTDDLPDIDDECALSAVAKVSAVSKTGTSTTVTLQITKLEVDVKAESPEEESKEGEVFQKGSSIRMK